MAKRLDDYKFLTNGRRGQYPWGDWLNGDIWELTRGEDFQVSPQSMRGAAQGAALRKGQRVHTRILDDKLILQAYTPGSS